MKKILLSMLLIILITVSAIAYWQRDNLTALINGTKYSSEELESKLDSNKENLKEEIKKYTNATIQDISAEDEKKLLSGEITLEEIAKKYNLPLDILTNGTKSFNYENNANTDSNTGTYSNTGNNNSSGNSDNLKAIDQAVSDGVTKMYALKAMYVSKLGEIERNILSEYTALPKEKQNEENKKEIIMKNIEYIAQVEKNCDDEVSYVLSHLDTELKRLNGDTEIIQVLQNAYEEEKEIKKSYYLSLYYN